MARERQSERGRVRYGICLNSDGEKKCNKAVAKEIQQISSRKEMVCAECGKPLRECPPPKTGPNKGLIVGVIVAIILLGGGAGAYFALNQTPAKKSTPIEVTQPDTVATPISTPVSTSDNMEVKKVDSNSLDLGFATYEGDIKNGKPHGNGTMTFTKKAVVPGSKDNIEAQAGEYVQGAWRNGEVNLVTLYQKNGNKVKIMHK